MSRSLVRRLSRFTVGYRARSKPMTASVEYPVCGVSADGCAAGVILEDGTILPCAGEPPMMPPTVTFGGNGQR
jgi:hypothetical protein